MATPAASPRAAQRVLRVALLSRAVISALSAATSLLVKPYDTSSRLLAPQVAPLAALANWDGVYFAHIAANGYDYEHVHAFFPLYALIVRYASRLMPLGEGTAIPLAGWIVSNACFVLASLYLYRLGCLVLQSEPIARRAAYLFCFAPSSIFMTAMYSESLICLLSFAGMYYLEAYRSTRRYPSLLLSAILFGAASATRSNGALLSLFMAWYRLRESPSPLSSPLRFLGFWLSTALLGVIAVGPQLAYFLQAIRSYCPTFVHTQFPAASIDTAITQDRPWCAKVVPNVTAMYMFIQREYWNVGLFRYYEMKQIPNFLLASPVLLLSGYSLFCFFTRRTTLHASATPYFVHWGFLFINALLIVHIQVTTRLLAACPPLYWAPAAMFFSTKSSARASLQGRAVVGYFLVFYVLGAGLFSSFYPWT